MLSTRAAGHDGPTLSIGLSLRLIAAGVRVTLAAYSGYV